jgi:hypothetical protein
MSGAHWQVYTPTQLMTGNTPRPTIDSGWNSLLAKYPEYSVTEQEVVNSEREISMNGRARLQSCRWDRNDERL